MKTLMAVLASLVLVSTAHADNFGLEVGFRQQSGSVDTIGTSSKSQVGYQMGVSALFGIAGDFGLRTGMFYTSRPILLESDFLSGSAKMSYNSFDIPLAVAYSFEEYANIFVGPVFAVKLDTSVEGSGVLANQKFTETQDSLIPLQIGASFKFAPQMGATVFFETLSGKVAKDLSSYRAVGVNFLMTFE